MNEEVTFGSVCSGIEAAQLAFNPFGLKQVWSSEIAEFPSKVLDFHYPHIPNVGDMTELPSLILDKKYSAPDVDPTYAIISPVLVSSDRNLP